MMMRSRRIESQRKNEIVMCSPAGQYCGNSKVRKDSVMADDRRRPMGTREAAEAAFKKATTKPVDLPPAKPAVPHVKETVSLRLDRDILDHFQSQGPGWQDRINSALRTLVKK
jgi:uncharacterized protein (DUF4415 family)